MKRKRRESGSGSRPGEGMSAATRPNVDVPEPDMPARPGVSPRLGTGVTRSIACTTAPRIDEDTLAMHGKPVKK